MKTRLLILLALFPLLLAAQQTSSLQKGLIFHAPLSAEHSQPLANITAAPLVVGAKYMIGVYGSGDVFTNVGASSNAAGVSFVATGPTPTTWTNGSILGRQDYYSYDVAGSTYGVNTDVYNVLDRQGNGRRGYDLDGVNDNVLLADNPDHDFGLGDFTVIWGDIIKSGVATAQTLINKQDGIGVPTAGYSLAARASDPYLRFYLADGTDLCQTVDFSTNYADNALHTIAVVVDRDVAVYIYVDGVLKDTETTNLSAIGNINSTYGLKLGYSHASNLPQSGSINRTQLFNRALSQTEVLAYQLDNTPMTFADRGASNTVLTSGTLTIGKRYKIVDWITDDDFVNVGGTNADGTIFVATGTTPTKWTNSSTVIAVGSTLSLTPSGMNGTYWYDPDQSVSATVSGATLSIPPASNLGAMQWNGLTSKITYVHTNGLTGDKTWTAWVQPTYIGENSAGRIFGNSKAIFGINSSYYLTFASDSATVVTSTPTALTVGVWAHVAVTRTTLGIANFYINGVLVGTANLASGTPASGLVHVWGNRTAGDRTWDGRMYDQRIYDKLLSTEDIAALAAGVR
jgi:hypothetical protein